MVASYLKVAKPKSKVLVLDANPEIQSKKACSNAPSSSTTTASSNTARTPS
jgi:hypothetical protein